MFLSKQNVTAITTATTIFIFFLLLSVPCFSEDQSQQHSSQVNVADDFTGGDFAGGDSTEALLERQKQKTRILTETQHISENIMSPYCPGRTLSSCPSPDARSLRNEISVWLERGYSRDAVMRQLKGMFGTSIEGSPEAKGFGIIAWTAPFAVLLVLFFVLIAYLQRSKDSEQKNHRAASSDQRLNTLESQLDEELKKRLGE